MLAFGGGRLRDNARRLYRTGGSRRGGLQPATKVATAGQGPNRAQHNGRSPKAAAHPVIAPSYTLRHRRHSVWGELVLAQPFYLPHPEHFDSGSAVCFDPAADPNPLVF